MKVCARASAHGLAWEACAPQGLHLPIDWREEKGAVLSIIRKVGEVHGVYCLDYAESADSALKSEGCWSVTAQPPANFAALAFSSPQVCFVTNLDPALTLDVLLAGNAFV